MKAKIIAIGSLSAETKIFEKGFSDTEFVTFLRESIQKLENKELNQIKIERGNE